LYHRLPDKEPTIFELRILKWVFLPILAIGIISIVVKDMSGMNKCESICKERSFAGYRYKPSDKYNIESEACHCLTEEETNVKDRVPKGTRVF
jgi:hypothetical protein